MMKTTWIIIKSKQKKHFPEGKSDEVRKKLFQLIQLKSQFCTEYIKLYFQLVTFLMLYTPQILLSGIHYKAALQSFPKSWFVSHVPSLREQICFQKPLVQRKKKVALMEQTRPLRKVQLELLFLIGRRFGHPFSIHPGTIKLKNEQLQGAQVRFVHTFTFAHFIRSQSHI